MRGTDDTTNNDKISRLLCLHSRSGSAKRWTEIGSADGIVGYIAADDNVNGRCSQGDMDGRCGDSSVDGWDGDRNVGNVGGSD